MVFDRFMSEKLSLFVIACGRGSDEVKYLIELVSTQLPGKCKLRNYEI